ncbi:MAG: hypothetical protein Q8R06_00465 [Polaromonas sp.]|uniref:hypothetical protein n=1 Tax=Polaromonas sp. TaxID=1869339 RepID=UPI0027355907|nr:hypothetical protein [Polaromonas sp.]MDP3795609.1 hypothetical protein [Polaromonas sp.]
MTTLSLICIACFFFENFEISSVKIKTNHDYQLYTFFNTPQNDNVVILQEKKILAVSLAMNGPFLQDLAQKPGNRGDHSRVEARLMPERRMNFPTHPLKKNP